MSETGRDPKRDFETLIKELESFSPAMLEKPMLVVASKMDASQDSKKVAALKRLAKKRGLPFFEISSATGKGVEELKFALAERVLPPMSGNSE
jgi:GTP-binding protein